jgi:hypothetical protein
MENTSTVLTGGETIVSPNRNQDSVPS